MPRHLVSLTHEASPSKKVAFENWFPGWEPVRFGAYDVGQDGGKVSQEVVNNLR
jgi:hypothetical protein